MNSNDATTIASFLTANFAYEMQTTERVINAVPTDHLDYRPDGKSKTALELLRHIVLEDEWLLNRIANGVFRLPRSIGRLRRHEPRRSHRPVQRQSPRRAG